MSSSSNDAPSVFLWWKVEPIFASKPIIWGYHSPYHALLFFWLSLKSRPWPNFLFPLPILLFLSAQFSTHFASYCTHFAFYDTHFASHQVMELINGVQYLERSTWHCGCTWNWNAINGPSKSTMPILLNLLYLTAHFASKLLIAFKSIFCSKFC